MNFIPPLEIASKIMTLIQDADKELIIVSPYVNLNNWDKMVKCLERTIRRGVNVKFIVRKNAKQDLSLLKNLGITPIMVDDLHAKVYINEKYGIVTSLNLLHYSDINSIDIAYSTQTEKQRIELVNFVDKYVYVQSTPTLINGISKPKNNISTHLTNKSIFFNEYQVEKVCSAFEKKFWKSKFTPTSTYIFCGDILPFGDIMMDSRLTIRIKKSRLDFDNIISKIEEINFINYHNLKLELDVTKKNNYNYLEFIPTRPIEIAKLIDDYFDVVTKINNHI